MAGNEIVVGLDDTASARAALQWAATQARLTGDRLTAIHVLDWPVGIATFGTEGEHGFIAANDVSAPYRRGMQRVFDDVRPASGWRLQFAEGETGPVLVEAARSAHLLVIGSRTRARWVEDVAGPVGHYCLSHMRCPLVTIPDVGDRT
jgi:nucleotide-binding universal stress UspA family protein